MNDWKPISSAPKDGTIILVTETANGEIFNVLPACYMNKNCDTEGWWAVTAVKRSDEPGELPTKFWALASTPVCWMPMPKSENINKLRRRLTQVLRFKYKNKAGAA